VALVVFLRGVNVGGHKTFRPTMLVDALKHLDPVNIGAAGTFVIRRPVAEAQLRAEIVSKLPFDADIMICQGREILRLVSEDPFAHQPTGPDITHFVSVMSKRRGASPLPTINFPPTGKWLMKILGSDKQFVLGLYRRHMKVIGYLGKLDQLLGVRVTTRNWNTITAIAKVLK
jgi:uncharacterized protein (DUF1697 family)